jgi:hypothetical protein
MLWAQDLEMNFISYEWHGNMTGDKNISFGSGTKYLGSCDSSVGCQEGIPTWKHYTGHVYGYTHVYRNDLLFIYCAKYPPRHAIQEYY